MPIDLVIVTPQGEAYSGPVESVVLPGSEGEFGVLEHHERLLCPLRIGEVEVRTSQGVAYVALAAGFAQVEGSKVVVLVESAEAAESIDVARAELARNRAEEHLASLDAAAEEQREYAAALERAVNRLRVARRGARS